MIKTFTVSSLLLFFVVLVISNHSYSEQLAPFTSDGCSAFPDGTFTQNELWLSCCISHDYDYWQGGTYQQRLASDQALKSCVANIGQPKIAALMLVGVRVGGTPYLPTKFRWGYGWSYPKLYGKLTQQELLQIKNLQVNLEKIVIE